MRTISDNFVMEQYRQDGLVDETSRWTIDAHLYPVRGGGQPGPSAMSIHTIYLQNAPLCRRRHLEMLDWERVDALLAGMFNLQRIHFDFLWDTGLPSFYLISFMLHTRMPRACRANMLSMGRYPDGPYDHSPGQEPQDIEARTQQELEAISSIYPPPALRTLYDVDVSASSPVPSPTVRPTTLVLLSKVGIPRGQPRLLRGMVLVRGRTPGQRVVVRYMLDDPRRACVSEIECRRVATLASLPPPFHYLVHGRCGGKFW